VRTFRWLRFRFIFATMRDPLALIPFDCAAADFCLTYSLPAGLAHQPASSLSLFNFGISGVFLFIALSPA
jgi:hypothetical protein